MTETAPRKRRPQGTGGLAWHAQKQRWRAKIRLSDGSFKTRSCRTREEAQVALEELLTQYEDRLGYHYYWAKPYRYGDRPVVPRPARTTISGKQRFDILERDRFRCRYCGVTAAIAELHVDHVVPVAKGGTNDPDNLVTSCGPCNMGKRDRDVTLAEPMKVKAWQVWDRMGGNIVDEFEPDLYAVVWIDQDGNPHSLADQLLFA